MDIRDYLGGVRSVIVSFSGNDVLMYISIIDTINKTITLNYCLLLFYVCIYDNNSPISTILLQIVICFKQTDSNPIHNSIIELDLHIYIVHNDTFPKDL